MCSSRAASEEGYCLQLALQGTYYLVAATSAAAKQLTLTAFFASIALQPGDTITGVLNAFFFFLLAGCP